MKQLLKNILKTFGASKLKDYGYLVFDEVLSSIRIVPQSYSFMVFGAHGVGLHAFLYYLSLCKDIYPMPIHILCPHKIWFGKYGEYISSRFLFYFIRNYDLFKNMIWGLTFDGTLKNMDWINRNCTLEVPAFSIVRDPIAILQSHINWNLSNNILEHNQIAIDLKSLDYMLSNLDISINFKTNLDKLKNQCESITYFDTKEIVGNLALKTMQTVGKKLGIPIHDLTPPPSVIKEFEKSINGPIQRRMPKVFNIGGVKFRVSTFCNQFSLFDPQYKREYPSIFNIFKTEYFPEMDFYIVADTPKISCFIQDKFYFELEQYLRLMSDRMKTYEFHKVGYMDVIDLLNQSKWCDTVKRKIEFELTDLVSKRYDIVKNWHAVNIFLKN